MSRRRPETSHIYKPGRARRLPKAGAGNKVLPSFIQIQLRRRSQRRHARPAHNGIAGERCELDQRRVWRVYFCRSLHTHAPPRRTPYRASHRASHYRTKHFSNPRPPRSKRSTTLPTRPDACNPASQPASLHFAAARTSHPANTPPQPPLGLHSPTACTLSCAFSRAIARQPMSFEI
jgi:hypothetical protein